MVVMTDSISSRRASGTEFLKECIADALIKLMDGKPYDKITVQEITDCANVGRATYFRQFSSKDDVLIYKIRLLWRRWAENRSLNKKNILSAENLMTFFEFIYSIRGISSVLVKAEKMNVLIIALSSEFGLDEPNDPYELYCFRYVAFGLTGVLAEWIKRDYLESPRDMIKCLTGIVFE